MWLKLFKISYHFYSLFGQIIIKQIAFSFNFKSYFYVIDDTVYIYIHGGMQRRHEDDSKVKIF